VHSESDQKVLVPIDTKIHPLAQPEDAKFEEAGLIIGPAV